MKKVVLREPGRLVLTEEGGPPAPGPGEALVRVRRVGVCGTDFHAFRGRQPFFTYPRVLGHELAVEVVDVGDAPDASGGELRPGDLCAVEPYINCERCVACRRGRPNCCVRLSVLGVHADGGMRELMSVPRRKLHRAPPTLPADHVALVEPLSIGAHAVGRARPEAGETVLVLGAGPIGLAVVQFASSAGVRLIVADVDRGRLDFCRRHFDVAAAVSAAGGAGGAADEVRELTGGDMPTLVFDATGSAESMTRAFDLVANGGRLVFVGLVQGAVAFSDPDFHRREMTLLGSRNATGADFERTIAMLGGGRINVAPWVTHRVRAGEVVETFPRWLEDKAGYIKGLIEF